MLLLEEEHVFTICFICCMLSMESQKKHLGGETRNTILGVKLTPLFIKKDQMYTLLWHNRYNYYTQCLQ